MQKEIVKLETILDGQRHHWPLELVESIGEIDHLLEQSAAVEPSMKDKLNDILRDWDTIKQAVENQFSRFLFGGVRQAGFRQSTNLMRAIQQEKGWKKKPVGPLGLHMQPKQQGWAMAVQNSLNECKDGDCLTTIVCDNSADQKLLSRILKQHPHTSARIVSCKFEDKPRCTALMDGSVELPAGVTTVGDQLTVESDMAFNLLVNCFGTNLLDQVLCEDRAQAEALVKHNSNVGSVFVKRDGQSVKSTNGSISFIPPTSNHSRLPPSHQIRDRLGPQVQTLCSNLTTATRGIATKSTVRRDMMLQWAHGNGLPATERTEVALLQFFAAHYALDQTVSSALLCHLAPVFSVANSAQFAQLPTTVMASLLGRDDLNVTAEIEVVETLKPWIETHSSTELLQLLPSVRLAWIPCRDLAALLTGGVLAPLRENAAVKQLVEEALGVQTLSGSKRRQQAEAPDQFMCPITHELMSDPVLASECARYA